MRITTVSSGRTTTHALISGRCGCRRARRLRSGVACERDMEADDQAAGGSRGGAEEAAPGVTGGRRVAAAIGQPEARSADYSARS